MFKVIESPEQLVALGKAGLLWYLCMERWQPSKNTIYDWDNYTEEGLQFCVKNREYAILLEE